MPKAQAVVPPPDGCYPNYTTAEGCNALSLLTTGTGNTGVGWYALFSNADASFNTGIGGGALALNNGHSNTAVGAAALLLNTSGTENTAVGTDAMVYNDAGNNNTAVGAFALFRTTQGNFNTAVGDRALQSNITGNNHTAVGFQALQHNIAPCVSAPAGFGSNTAVGDNALTTNTCGDGNTAVGSLALLSNDTGYSNVAIGAAAGANNTTGNSNTALGTNAGLNVSTANNVICIGAFGANVDNSCFIGNIYSNVQPLVGTDPDSVTITSAGRLGRGDVSSRRYKHDIQPMDKASEAIYTLKPVSFRYYKEYDPTQTIAFGLIAEDVATVNPDLVGRNPAGQPESVRYDQINAMLLNEFLKEHRAFVEQQHEVEKLKATVADLLATVKEQAEQIQKVSTQLEMFRPAAKVAVNKP